MIMTAEEIRINFYNEDDSRAYDQDELYLMKEYAKLKCEELLKIVAEKGKTENIYPKYVLNEFDEFEHVIVDKDSILNAVDLDEFIK